MVALIIFRNATKFHSCTLLTQTSLLFLLFPCAVQALEYLYFTFFCSLILNFPQTAMKMHHVKRLAQIKLKNQKCIIFRFCSSNYLHYLSFLDVFFHGQYNYLFFFKKITLRVVTGQGRSSLISAMYSYGFSYVFVCQGASKLEFFLCFSALGFCLFFWNIHTMFCFFSSYSEYHFPNLLCYHHFGKARVFRNPVYHLKNSFLPSALCGCHFPCHTYKHTQ